MPAPSDINRDTIAATERAIRQHIRWTPILECPWRRCWDRERLASSGKQPAPDLETLLVAVGGGGLIAGIAAWSQVR